MNVDQILPMARKIGYDNFVQIQNLRRVAKSERGQAAATLVLSTDVRYDQFIMSKIGVGAEADDASYNILKKFFPKSLSDKAYSYIDVLLKKFSKNSGVLSMDISTRANGELLSNSTLNVWRNNSVTKVKAGGFSLENGTYMDVKALFPSKGAKMPDAEQVFKEIDYKEADGMAKLGFTYKAPTGLTSINVKYETPKELADAVVEVGTCGDIKSMQEFIDHVKFLSSPAMKCVEEAEFNRIMARHPEFDIPTIKDLPDDIVPFS